MDDYVIQFEEFDGFTGFDDAALTEIFKEGLTPQILSRCYGLEVIPATLTTWKEKARLFHRHYLKLQQQQSHQAGQPQQQQQSGLRRCYTTKGFLPEASEVDEKWTVIQSWGLSSYSRSVYILIPLLCSHSSSARTTCSVTAILAPTFHRIRTIMHRHSFPVNSALPS
jgi:hypothetical protein